MFPNQFLGWLVLQRSGLGPQERSVILAQSQGLELTAIEEALKRQWDDTELREHDSKAKRFQEKPGRRGRAYLGDADGDELASHSDNSAEQEYEEADVGDPDERGWDSDASDFLDDLEHDILHAEYSDDEDREEAENILAIFRKTRKDFRKSRRTLAQAKGMMRTIRKERKFFPRRRSEKPTSMTLAPPKGASKGRQKRAPTPGRKLRPKSPSSGAVRGDTSEMLCFRCGKPGHRAADCKNPPASKFIEEESQLVDLFFVGTVEHCEASGGETWETPKVHVRKASRRAKSLKNQGQREPPQSTVPRGNTPTPHHLIPSPPFRAMVKGGKPTGKPKGGEWLSTTRKRSLWQEHL